MKFQILFDYLCYTFLVIHHSFRPNFVLDLDGWFGVLPNNFFFFFHIPLLYYYINLRSSTTIYLSSGDIYFSLGISLSNSFVIVSELFCVDLLDTFAILSAILLPIKLPVASAVFWITLFKVVLSSSVADSLAWSKKGFWLYLPLKYLLIF